MNMGGSHCINIVHDHRHLGNQRGSGGQFAALLSLYALKSRELVRDEEGSWLSPPGLVEGFAASYQLSALPLVQEFLQHRGMCRCRRLGFARQELQAKIWHMVGVPPRKRKREI